MNKPNRVRDGGNLEDYTKWLLTEVMRPPSMKEPPRTEIPKELRHALLRLWDKAVGTPEYKKTEWQDLEALINRLAKKESQNP
jgi:hypothetical protein